MYQLLFAYIQGDPNRQQLAAGVATRFMLRMALTYKGAVFYKMRAGMGDVVFAPLYEVLKRRGVQFHLFHKVDKLRVNPLTREMQPGGADAAGTAEEPGGGLSAAGGRAGAALLA